MDGQCMGYLHDNENPKSLKLNKSTAAARRSKTNNNSTRRKGPALFWSGLELPHWNSRCHLLGPLQVHFRILALGLIDAQMVE